MNISLQKIMKTSASVLLLLLLSLRMLPTGTYAADSYSSISSVRISLDESLKELKPGDELPALSLSSVEVGDESKYRATSVEWYDSSMLSALPVGASPQIVVVLEAQIKQKSNGDELEYRFNRSYGASNITVRNGEFVSAKLNGKYELDVTVRLRAVKGQYSAPENLYWDSSNVGTAGWQKGSNSSGYYEVTLLRDGRQVTSITTDLTSLNLYPWMENEGSYSFRVRSVPYTEEQKKYGKNSDAAESPGYLIQASNKSYGNGKYGPTLITGITSGNNSGSTQTGWYQMNGLWYFRNPNGTPVVNSWLNFNGLRYRFNERGEMRTGWFQDTDKKWYYLKPEVGYMKKNWQFIDGKWYYFEPKEGSEEGSMYRDCFAEIHGQTYYFDLSGGMRTRWVSAQQSDGTVKYFYFNDQGQLQRNITVDGFRVGSDGAWVH